MRLGPARRWPGGVPAGEAQVERELVLIAELQYEAYFLTVFDIVNFARSRGILCQGRGSAANSAVCHALGSPRSTRHRRTCLRAFPSPEERASRRTSTSTSSTSGARR